MLEDDAIDEDLEALLYAQVYHGQSDLNDGDQDGTFSTALILPSTGSDRRYHKPTKRYFEKPINRENVQRMREISPVIQGTSASTTNVQSINPMRENSSTLTEADLHNNTLDTNRETSENMIVEPSVQKRSADFQKRLEYFTENIHWSRDCVKDYHLLQKGKLSEYEFFQKMNQRLSENSSTLTENFTEADFHNNTLDTNREKSTNMIVEPSVQKSSADFQKRLEYFKEKIPWSRNCVKDYYMLQIGRLYESEFFQNMNRRLKEHELKLRAIEHRKQNFPEVINVSSDSSDLEVIETTVGNPSPKNELKPNTVKAGTKSTIISEDKSLQEGDGDDDAVIYIAPPPIPVINVEESDSEAISPENDGKGDQEIHHDEVDDTSNDFLGSELNCSTENFNFSLHGSEFQNSDFVRPANPTDVYETESSTSTSDFNKESNRNFSNTVKTIVFNEVDFPKEVFTENNLESFSELIMPKRQSTATENAPQSEIDNITTSKEQNSSGSSESDYQTPNIQSNLPDLTPILSSSPSTRENKLKCGSVRKSSKKKSKRSDEEVLTDAPKKKVKKKKKVLKSSNTTIPTDLVNDANIESEEESELLVTSTPKLLKKKKKRKSRNDDESLSQSKKQKMKRDHSERISMTELENETEDAVQQNLTENESILDSTIPIQSPEKESEANQQKKATKKKKQKKSESSSTSIESDITIECNKPQADNSDISEPIEPVIQDDTHSNSDNKTCENVTNAHKNGKEQEAVQFYELNKDISDCNLIITDDNTEEAQITEILSDKDDDDLIVVDDVCSPKLQQVVYVIDSSDSDGDFRNFDGVGDNLVLANTNEENISRNKDLSEFDLDNIHKKMSSDPSKWQILESDVLMLPSPARGPRCHKCREKGHLAFKCPNKPMLPSCTMCGHTGHYEPRCPNKICLTCGNPGNYSTIFCWKCVKRRKAVCRLCNIPGHMADYCPDLWRRYHLTTEDGPLVQPVGQHSLKDRKDQWCSGCATQGHLEYECQSYKWQREYPASSPAIFQYQNVYQPKKSFNRSPLKGNVSLDKNKSSENLIASQSFLQGIGGNMDYSQDNVENERQNINNKQNTSDTYRSNERVFRESPRSHSRNKKPKINPVLFSKGHHSTTSTYESYQNVLNPYSLFNTIPPSTSLFRPIPNTVIMNQLNVIGGDLTTTVPQTLIDLQRPSFIIDTKGEPNLNSTLGAGRSIQSDDYSNSNDAPSQIPPEYNEKYKNNLSYAVTRKFFDCTYDTIKNFLRSELKKLDNMDPNVKIYRRKFSIIENLNKVGLKNKSIKLQLYSLYKKINMYLFGVMKICNGQSHLTNLQDFIYSSHNPRAILKAATRKDIIESYGYIFGGQHAHFKYKSHLNKLSVKQHSNA